MLILEMSYLVNMSLFAKLIFCNIFHACLNRVAVAHDGLTPLSKRNVKILFYRHQHIGGLFRLLDDGQSLCACAHN